LGAFFSWSDRVSITLSTKQLPPIAERMAQTWGHLQIRHEKYAKFSQLGSVLKSETGSPDFLNGYITTLTFISISLSVLFVHNQPERNGIFADRDAEVQWPGGWKSYGADQRRAGLWGG